jgi:hypothetical protein
VYEIYYLGETFSKIDGAQNHYAIVIDNRKIFSLAFNLLTSQYDEKSEKIKLHYYPIIDWKEAGLKKQTYVDILSLVEYDIAQIRKYAEHKGTLQKRDILGFVQFVKSYTYRLSKFNQNIEK